MTSRRSALKLLVSGVALMASTAVSTGAWAQEPPLDAAFDFSFDALTERMRLKAAEPFQAVTFELPEYLSALNYDTYRLVRFRRDNSRLADSGTPYRLEAFHLGWLHKEPVQLFEVSAGKAQSMGFSESDFETLNDFSFGEHANDELAGVAGFRINYPINNPTQIDELVAFLGASYFRALGRGNLYGLSARGLLINSWREGPEEFPRFSEFYVEKPSGTGPLVIYAVLDSQSVVGAYRFDITPAGQGMQETVMEVTARLFFRNDIPELGIAPLTSMFLFGQNNRSQFDDYRPRVHDSNGLHLETSHGQVMWRALNNPTTLGNSYFFESNLRGFGLYQRGRDFEEYQDAGAHYERRPSLRVEPIGDWGEGYVRLIEIPSKLEADDNIVAFWVPGTEPIKAGEDYEFRYRLRWGNLDPDTSAGLAYVTETRAGIGGVSGVENAETLRKFVVDFAGGELAGLEASTELEALVEASAGKVMVSTLSKIETNGVWRLVVDIDTAGAELIELKAQVMQSERTLSETWLYQWKAQQ